MTVNELSLIIGLAAIFLIVALLVKMFTRKKSIVCQPNNQIYVGNLPYSVTEADLQNFFSEFGEITQIRIVKNHATGRSKGYSFVTYTANDEAEKALQAHGKDIRGRNMVVRIAKPRPSHSYVNA